MTRQRGFTLVELVASVTVLTLVVGPLVSASVLFVQHAGNASEYFADDSAVRTASALFITDAQSADSVAAPDGAPCGSSDPALVTTSWDDAGTVYRASWFAVPSGGVTALLRRRCTGTTLVSTVVVGDVAAPPVVLCTPTCSAPETLELSGTTLFGSAFTITAHRRVS